MKKFWVGLLSVFLLIGGGILSACGKPAVSISLNATNVSICLNDDSSHTAEVFAKVDGIDGGTVTPSSSYENIATATAVYNSATGENIVTIKGLSEGTADIILTSDFDSSVRRVVSVTVYSNLESMGQLKEDTNEANKSNQFAVRGEEIELIEKNLLDCYPAKARKNIEWTLKDSSVGEIIDGNKIKVNQDYDRKNANGYEPVILIATDTYTDISTEISLAVLDPIVTDSIDMTWGYPNRDLTDLAGAKIEIVPNISRDPQYTANIRLAFPNIADIEASAITIMDGKENAKQTTILSQGSTVEGGAKVYTFEVKGTAQDLNKEFDAYFKIGYAKYNYSVKSQGFSVTCYEQINKMQVINEGGAIVGSSDSKEDEEKKPQNIYTSYANVNGTPFKINLTPTSAIKAEGGYTIQVVYPVGTKANENTLSFSYRNPISGNTPVGLNFEEGGSYPTFVSGKVLAKEIYLIAHLPGVNSIPNVRVTFTSTDNEKVSAVCNLNLYKSASAISVEGIKVGNTDVEDKKLNLPTDRLNSVVTATLTLKGQTTVEGLHIVKTKGEELFSVSNPKNVTSNEENNTVSFDLDFSLNEIALGKTADCKYKIVHENGIESEVLDLSLYLPLTSVRVSFDNDNSSVTKYEYSRDEQSGVYDVSSLLVRNGSDVPLNIQTNSTQGNFAGYNLEVSYFDFDKNATYGKDAQSILKDIEAFRSKKLSEEEIASALPSSNVISYSKQNNVISVTNTGLTYLILRFTGLEDGKEFTKIILIESYVAPTSFEMSPSSVTLYANNSVSSKNSNETWADVEIRLSSAPMTYFRRDYFEFYSSYLRGDAQDSVSGKGTMSGNRVEWEDGNGYYSISNIAVTSTGISFRLHAITTKGLSSFTDGLTIKYHNKYKDEPSLYLEGTLDIQIKNADRIEKVIWENESKDGIYFDSRNQESAILVFTTTPTNAKNQELSYIVTDKNGNDLQNDAYSFVEVRNLDSNGEVLLHGTRGSGYIYVLPSDAIYNREISYYDYSDGNPLTSHKIASSDIGKKIDENEETTWFDYLYENAYFINNSGKEVPFKDFIIKIPVTVADGSDEEYAERIYSAEELRKIDPSKFYQLMNSVSVDNWEGFSEFTGGIRGNDSSVVINLNGNSFVDTNKGVIRNLTFVGDVSGGGFVANVNEGTIDNVTIDVNGTRSSVLMSTGSYAGGIAGTNKKTISNVQVLGLTISGAGDYVGGIVGKSENGKIENVRFEIYNFKDGANTITGNNVGGVVGYYDGGDISRVYAYDYTYASGATHLIGNAGALVGYANNDLTIEKSFAVVNANKAVGALAENANLTLRNGYVSYYKDSTYTSIIYNNNGDKTTNYSSLNSGIWETAASYVNGDYPYLKDFYQAEALNETTFAGFGAASVVKEDNGIYHALGYKSKADSGYNDKAILFNYAVGGIDYALMNDGEKAALMQYNTITLVSLLGLENASDANRLVVISSNASIVEVSGSNLIIKQNGNVTLTLSSKQDYNLRKTIEVDVIYALSDLVATWAYQNGSQQINEGDDIRVQRARNFTVVYELQHDSLFLGTRGNRYQLLNNAYRLVHSDENRVQAIGENIIEIDTNTSDDTINIKTQLELTGSDYVKFNDVIKNIFQRNYSLALFDGAISINSSLDGVSITPSSMGQVKVTLKTGKAGDDLAPSIKLVDGDSKLDLTVSEEKDSKGTYIAKLGNVERLKIQIVRETPENVSAENGFYYYDFTILISVAKDYRGKISKNQTYKLTLTSNAQVVSESVDVYVSRQGFTNISMTNHSVYNQTNEPVGNNRYAIMNWIREDQTTSVISPGTSSILKVNINPAYAYYHHFTMEYSGANFVGAATIKFMSQNGSGKYFEDTSSQISQIPNGISVIPSANLKGSSFLNFKVWANDEINQDVELKLTIKFYVESEAEPIASANYFLGVSYLPEPEVLVDGASTAILARGQTAEVKIVVPIEQEIDIRTVKLSNTENAGIFLDSGNWVRTEEMYTGKNGVPVRSQIFTTTISAAVDARLKADANGVFRISVIVSRVINGHEESKEASADVNLVDFKLDAEHISLSDGENDTFIASLGVGNELRFDYPLLPEEYIYDTSDAESAAAAREIQNKIEMFQNGGYINGVKNNLNYTYYDNAEQYYINYGRDKNGNVERSSPLSLVDRLSYYSRATDNYVSLREGGKYSSVGGYLSWNWNQEGNILKVTGKSLTNDSEPIRMKLETTVQVGNFYFVYEYFFNILVKAYSDEDTPLTVSNVNDFMAMNSGDPQDYILLDDIVLTNYTPFDTTLISSLDGNGYTIYIDSFNLYPDGSGKTLNLALFNKVTENTTLKNVRVNIYNGGQITADIQEYNAINVAGLAIENEGIITNCEVVAFQSGSARVDNPGINVRYIRGRNTDSLQYITDTSTWTSRVAGFVISNSGSITNSRVGGTEVKVFVADTTNENGVVDGHVLEPITLGKFNIKAQGNMAGFVLENSRYISSSYAANLGMENESSSTSMYTAGFVGNNASSGRVITSYVEGVKEDRPKDAWCLQGSAISSKFGIISGFVYANDGRVQDAYSNILISNTSTEQSYLASGFVYMNGGRLENCLSVSQIASLQYSQMNFSGVDKTGNLLANGEYVNCYYYSTHSANEDSPTETSYNTAATQLTTLDDKKFYYGFSFNSDKQVSDGIWTLAYERGAITLVEPNQIAISNRYFLPREDLKDAYYLPYSTLQERGGNPIDARYGSESNPIIIRSAREFANVMGNSAPTTNVAQFFTDTKITGNYRIVNDLDFADLFVVDEETNEKVVRLPSTSKAFAGKLFGNGFNISNLSIRSSEEQTGFGLFASVQGAKQTNDSIKKASIINLNLSVNKASDNRANFVGALAGYVENANLVNITVTNAATAEVEGLNFVGGVAGMVFGDSKIKNISVTSPTVKADRYDRNLEEPYNRTNYLALRELILTRIAGAFITAISRDTIAPVLNYIDSQSYAGGAFGYVDIFTDDERNTTNYVYDNAEKRSIELYDVSRVRILEGANVQAQVAGGAIGFSGAQADLKDVGMILNAPSLNSTSSSGTAAVKDSHIIATQFYAGGLVGQSYGNMTQMFARYSDSIQNTIENGLASYYSSPSDVERGSVNIFSTVGTEEEYKAKYVGGLVGFAGSGQLTVSYSKLNVVNTESDYAGGVIGYIDSSDAIGDDVPDGRDTYISKYYIKEVYATGDVRADSGAGGIIGKVEQGSGVSLAYVNAVNFISLYNYSVGVNYFADALQEGNIYTFDKINVYAIAGNAGNINSSDLKFLNRTVLTKDENGSSGSASTKPEDQTSVGRVGAYANGITGDGNAVLISAYKGSVKEGENAAGEDIKTNDFDREEAFQITSPSAFADAETGYDETYAFFLGSDWSGANWKHESATLYPDIKFKLAENEFIWLDRWNIGQVLTQMQNSDIEVRVRGLITQNADLTNPNNYDDVNIAKFIAENPSFVGSDNRGVVSNYNGRLMGWQNKAGGRKDLIIDRPLFQDVNSGFRLSNLTIWMAPEGKINDPSAARTGMFATGSEYHAGFVNNMISDGRIEDVTLKITGPSMTFTGMNGNAGLLATNLVNTSINGLDVFIKEIGSSSAILNATAANNVGLIAGSVLNESVTTMNLRDINIYVSSETELINVDENGDGDLNVGAYFGSLTKQAGEGRPAKINLGIGVIGRTGAKDSNWDSITDILDDGTGFAKISVNRASGELNFGGYIGTVKGGLNSVETTDKSSYVELQMLQNVTTANVGGMFGYLEQGVNIGNGNTSFNLNSKIYSRGGNTRINSASIGGLVGQSSGNTLSINNIATNFELFGQDSNNKSALTGESEKFINGFKFTANDFHPFNVQNNAYVGGLVGQAGADVTISATSGQAFNDQYQGISVESTNGTAYAGGLVGRATAALAISGKIKSNAIINSNGTQGNYVGGFVGQASLKSGNANDSSQQEHVTIAKATTEKARTNDGATLQFNGQIFTSTTSTIGGIIGDFYISDASNDRSILKVQDTSFGGAIKVFGAGADGKPFNIGGSIGVISHVNKEKYIPVDVESNYNYGDVFMLYENGGFEKHGTLTYGGIVGNATKTAKANNAGFTNNYSLVTLNDQRPNSGNMENVNAMFGSPSDAIDTQNNFYNAAVSLLTDDKAIEAGYMTSYSASKQFIGGGYTKKKEDGTDEEQSDKILASIIAGKVGESSEGTKLNPKQLKSNVEVKNIEKPTNGMTYYYVTSTTHEITLTSQITTELENVALIGDGFTIDYHGENNSSIGSSPIGTLSGQSFIAGINFNVNINDDNTAGGNLATGGIINTIESGIVYAVGVTGEMSVGGSRALNLGGIAGTIKDGLISESVSDIHMIYRAGQEKNTNGTVKTYGKASAITNYASGTAIIQNSYAVGTVECYIDVQIDGFSQGAIDVRNSYTSANLEWHDYTSAETEDKKGHISVFRDSTVTSSYYDSNVVSTFTENRPSTTALTVDPTKRNSQTITQHAINKTTAELKTAKDDDGLMGLNWTAAPEFNYGYPTRKFNYLKYSSYATRGDNEYKEGSEEYKRGIEKYPYTRLVGKNMWQTVNNVTSHVTVNQVNSITAYYYIPNAGVWRAKIDQGMYIILRNDLHLNYFKKADTENLPNGYNGNDGSVMFSGTVGSFSALRIDGQGHRIYGFNGTSMFGNLSTNSSLINFDVLEANANGGAIVAQSATSTTFSSITLSGTVTGMVTNNEETYAGGLAGSLTGGVNISSVMNNAKIDSSATYIGGLIGSTGAGQGEVKIQYCVNNGPINGTSATGEIHVGGIVGAMESDATITYSYNTTSVTSGFVVNGETGTNYVGGVVGYNNGGNINNCYSSGLVRAGNKACQTKQYAGGIVGYSNNGTISNCINEASVEALSVNSNFHFEGRWTEKYLGEKKNDENDFFIDVISDTPRYVYADAIGFAGAAGIWKSTAGGTSNNDNNNYNTNSDIINNGSAFGNNIVVDKQHVYFANGKYGDVSSRPIFPTRPGMLPSISSAWYDSSIGVYGNTKYDYAFLRTYLDESYNQHEFGDPKEPAHKTGYSLIRGHNLRDDENVDGIKGKGIENSENYTITSVDNYNYPQTFYLEVKGYYKLQLFGFDAKHIGVWHHIFYDAEYIRTYDDYIPLTTGGYLTGKDYLSLLDNNITKTVSLIGNDIKKSIIGGELDKGQEIDGKSLKINGKDYYFTNKAQGLYDAVANSYSYNIEVATDFPFVDNNENYSISSMTTNSLASIFGYRIESVNKRADGKTLVGIKFYASEVVDSVNIELNFRQEESYILDLSNSGFSVYEEDDRVEIYVDDIFGEEENVSSDFRTESGDLVYKAGLNGKEIYVSYDDGRLIYVKGLQVKDGTNEDPEKLFTVNADNLSPSDFSQQSVTIYYNQVISSASSDILTATQDVISGSVKFEFDLGKPAEDVIVGNITIGSGPDVYDFGLEENETDARYAMTYYSKVAKVIGDDGSERDQIYTMEKDANNIYNFFLVLNPTGTEHRIRFDSEANTWENVTWIDDNDGQGKYFEYIASEEDGSSHIYRMYQSMLTTGLGLSITGVQRQGNKVIFDINPDGLTGEIALDVTIGLDEESIAKNININLPMREVVSEDIGETEGWTVSVNGEVLENLDELKTAYDYKPNGADYVVIGKTKSDNFDEQDIPLETVNVQNADAKIVLTGNVNLGYIESPGVFNGFINGNGHTLSYYTDSGSLFNTIKPNKHIIDISIVGQVRGYMAIGSGNYSASVVSINNEGSLNNVNAFGNIRNVEFRKSAYASGVVHSNSGSLNGVSNYVAINGIDSYSLINSAPTISGIMYENINDSQMAVNNLVNNGVLIAGDGYKGEKSVDGESIGYYEIDNGTYIEAYANGKTPKVATDGQNGGNIQTICYSSITKITEVSNEQYVFAGNGGAAGAGGNGGRGRIMPSRRVRDLSITARINIDGGQGGNSGINGILGEVCSIRKVGDLFPHEYDEAGKGYISIGISNGAKASDGSAGMSGIALPYYSYSLYREGTLYEWNAHVEGVPITQWGSKPPIQTKSNRDYLVNRYGGVLRGDVAYPYIQRHSVLLELLFDESWPNNSLTGWVTNPIPKEKDLSNRDILAVGCGNYKTAQ